MAATQLSLFGQVSQELYAVLIERLSSASQLGISYEALETVFERGTELPGGGTGSDENRLRLRETRPGKDGERMWSLHVYQKPEPLRLSPEMLSRSVIECPIAEGDPTSLVSALGYARLFTLCERGHRFHRGAVVTSVYQLYETASSTTPLDPSSWIVNLSTKCPRVANPTGASTPQAGPSAQEVKIQATERMREVAGLLRGVVDLARVE